MTDQVVSQAPVPDTIKPAPAGGGADSFVPQRSSRLRSDFLWSFISNAVFAACQMGMYVALSKLGTDKDLGYYALGMSVAGPLFVFGKLNLRALLATDVGQDYSFGQYEALRLLMMLLAAGILAVVAATMSDTFFVFAVMMAVGLTRLIEALEDLVYGQFQQSLRIPWLAISKTMRGILGVGCLVVTMLWLGNLAIAVAVMGASWILTILFYDMPRLKRLTRIRPQWQPVKALWRLAKLALPLGLSTAVVSLVVYCPRFFVLAYEGEIVLGRFTAISQVLQIVVMVAAALSQVTAPRLAGYFQANPRMYAALLKKLVVMTLAGGTVALGLAWLLGPWVLSVVFAPEFAEYHPLLVLFVGVGMASAMALFIGVAATAGRVLKAQLLSQVARVLMLLGLCALLVPYWGVYGAAWAMILATLVSMTITGSAVFLRWRSRVAEHSMIA